MMCCLFGLTDDYGEPWVCFHRLVQLTLQSNVCKHTTGANLELLTLVDKRFVRTYEQLSYQRKCTLLRLNTTIFVHLRGIVLYLDTCQREKRVPSKRVNQLLKALDIYFLPSSTASHKVQAKKPSWFQKLKPRMQNQHCKNAQRCENAKKLPSLTRPTLPRQKSDQARLFDEFKHQAAQAPLWPTAATAVQVATPLLSTNYDWAQATAVDNLDVTCNVDVYTYDSQFDNVADKMCTTQSTMTLLDVTAATASSSNEAERITTQLACIENCAIEDTNLCGRSATPTQEIQRLRTLNTHMLYMLRKRKQEKDNMLYMLRKSDWEKDLLYEHITSLIADETRLTGELDRNVAHQQAYANCLHKEVPSLRDELKAQNFSCQTLTQLCQLYRSRAQQLQLELDAAAESPTMTSSTTTCWSEDTQQNAWLVSPSNTTATVTAPTAMTTTHGWTRPSPSPSSPLLYNQQQLYQQQQQQVVDHTTSDNYYVAPEEQSVLVSSTYSYCENSADAISAKIDDDRGFLLSFEDDELLSWARSFINDDGHSVNNAATITNNNLKQYPEHIVQ